MAEYQFECEVGGFHDGLVKAKNKQEALKKAEEELELENLQALSKITLTKVPKEDEVGLEE